MRKRAQLPATRAQLLTGHPGPLMLKLTKERKHAAVLEWGMNEMPAHTGYTTRYFSLYIVISIYNQLTKVHDHVNKWCSQVFTGKQIFSSPSIKNKPKLQAHERTHMSCIGTEASPYKKKFICEYQVIGDELKILRYH